jgi:toxin secretion/phage lysis holin
VNIQKDVILTAFGIVGSFIVTLFGGWDMGLQTLILFMAIDYVSGVMVALVFKKSKKTENGGISSVVGLKGICKKVMSLLLVLIGFKLDLVLGVHILRNTVIIAIICNEVISIIENSALMGVKVPKIIDKVIKFIDKKVDGVTDNIEQEFLNKDGDEK